MPRYVYYCSTCHQEFEVNKPMSRAATAEKCPGCVSPGKRVFTAPGISIKGAKVKFQGNDGALGCEGCSRQACDLK